MFAYSRTVRILQIASTLLTIWSAVAALRNMLIKRRRTWGLLKKVVKNLG